MAWSLQLLDKWVQIYYLWESALKKKTGRAKCRAAGNTGASGGCRTGPKVWSASSTSPHELELTTSGSGSPSQAQTEAEVSHWLQAAAQIQVETSLLSKAERLSAGHTAPSRERGWGGREYRGLIVKPRRPFMCASAVFRKPEPLVCNRGLLRF